MLSDEIQIDSYLTQIDRHLKRVPPALRWNIIADVRSQISSACTKDPDRSIASILESLGKPKSVAMQYSGQQPKFAKLKKAVLVVGTCAAALFLVWKFSRSFVEIPTAPDGRVLTSYNKYSKFKFGSLYMSYLMPLKSSGVKVLNVSIQNADLALHYGNAEEIDLVCKQHKLQDGEPHTEHIDGVLKMSLTDAGSCELTLPNGFESEITVMNGDITIPDAAAPLSISVQDGQVHLGEAQRRDVRYDLTVQKGHVDPFRSSTQTDAMPVIVKVGTGSILKVRET